ncbi:hypothetical protein CsSME_00026721 [Camellia sinensis var. sinensis]
MHVYLSADPPIVKKEKRRGEVMFFSIFLLYSSLSDSFIICFKHAALHLACSQRSGTVPHGAHFCLQ